MKWFNIKMKDGDLFLINEEQCKTLRNILSQKFSVRPDFYSPNEDITIKVDFIASIQPDKDDF